jgi:hypothetical protein
VHARKRRSANLSDSRIFARAAGHVGAMHDDEAATGVAYEVHDAPSLERRAEEEPRAEDEQPRPPLPRRFRRVVTFAPVEPMS